MTTPNTDKGLLLVDGPNLPPTPIDLLDGVEHGTATFPDASQVRLDTDDNSGEV